ncbi:unnamed protein product, partial [Mesorhabditis belari]|uniref:B30.2/SPRY domain-containing protein n=1 Tax=Mesorhabditis belari TaxID=2138241 RepID=A0AAF3F3Y7_9BILA
MFNNVVTFDDTSNDDEYGEGSSIGSEIVSGRSSGTFSTETFAHEENANETMRRLKALYPFAVANNASLPLHWNPQDKSELIELQHNCLRVSNRGQKTSHTSHAINPNSDKATAALIRANAPVPRLCGIYYFEVTISQGKDGRVGVGFGPRTMGTARMPGWDPHSYAYHGDDGYFFTSDGNGREYGPKFKENDTVGAGINLVEQTVFFTLNGKNLGSASKVQISDSAIQLYPALGLQSPDEIVDSNFGQKPFIYNIDKDLQNLQKEVGDEIENVALPAEKGTWMNSAICSWLLSEGHVRALTALTRLTKTNLNFTEEGINRRNSIRSLIISKRSSEAADRIEQFYPQLFAENRKIELFLKCQVFVEKSQSIILETKGSTTSLNGMPTLKRTNRPSRGQKRRQQDSEAGTSREEPPTRRSPANNQTDESVQNGCAKNGNFKNGNEKNGNLMGSGLMGTTTIEDEDAEDEAMDGVIRIDDENTSTNRCGYSLIDKTEADGKLGEIITYGQHVSKLRTQCEIDLNGDEKALINDALMAILSDVNDFAKLAHMQPGHREKLAQDVNAAIMKYEGYKPISLLDTYYNTIHLTKRRLLKEKHPKSPFINVDSLFSSIDFVHTPKISFDDAQMDVEQK